MQESSRRELHVSAHVQAKTLTIRFHDTGPGVEDPEQLFEPFHAGASGNGMGLYVSRFILRSFGGELRHEPVASGACFAVELATA